MNFGSEHFSFAPFSADYGNASSNWTQNKTFPPNTNSASLIEEPLIVKAFKTFSIVLMIIFSLVGNSLVIGSIYQNVNRRMRSVSNYLIVNLSIADILITVCNMPRFITLIFVGYEWLIDGPIGLLLCKINSSVPFASLYVSTLSFAFIALDRFIALFFPLRRPITGKIVALIIAGTWIIPLSCYYLLFHYARLLKINGKTYCANALVRELLKTQDNLKIYLTVEVVMVTAIPLAITVALYSAIAVKMCTRTTPGNQTAANTARNRAINRKVITMLATVVLVFCICWLPTWVTLNLCQGNSIHELCFNSAFIFFKYFMAYSNSTLTPYIYPIFNQNFRDGFKHILNQIVPCCCGRCCHQVATNQVLPLSGSANRTERRFITTSV